LQNFPIEQSWYVEELLRAQLWSLALLSVAVKGLLVAPET